MLIRIFRGQHFMPLANYNLRILQQLLLCCHCFFEKVDKPAMVKHGMTIMKEITSYLNPGQIPVLACDCPIFAQCKYIQWKWPQTHGEDKIIIMLGDLHVEKALWYATGDLLASSGWTDGIFGMD